MAFLMCKSIPVYATRTKQVLVPNLMPCPPEFYEQWRNARQFLRGINRMPEEDELELGEDSITVKRRLSLSDAYWVKYNKNSNAKYDDINPYTNEFFEYGVCASRKSSPSLTVTGSVNKSWKRVGSKTVLYKVMRPEWVTAENAAVALAKRLELPVNDVTVISPTELHVHNFTTPEMMLMRLHTWDLQVKSRAKVPANFGSTFSALDEVYARLGIQGNFHIIIALLT